MNPLPLRVWIDAQMPPSLARRLAREVGVDGVHVDDLGLRTATDSEIFTAARAGNVIVVSKDTDSSTCLSGTARPRKFSG